MIKFGQSCCFTCGDAERSMRVLHCFLYNLQLCGVVHKLSCYVLRITLKMLPCLPRKYYSQPFPKPGRNVIQYSVGLGPLTNLISRNVRYRSVGPGPSFLSSPCLTFLATQPGTIPPNWGLNVDHVRAP